MTIYEIEYTFVWTRVELVSEWMCNCYLTPTQQFSAMSWRVNFQWDDDEIRFVLDQHA
jgi:hypothetical protein